MDPKETQTETPKDVNVTLSGHERLCLVVLLPNQGHGIDLKVYRELEEDLSLTSEELIAVDFNPTEDILKLTTDQAAKIPDKNFTWPQSKWAVIKREVSKAEKAGNLIKHLLPFWEQYIEGR